MTATWTGTLRRGAGSPTGVLRGAAVFMAANAGFFLFGAGGAKHDADGLPKPRLQKLIDAERLSASKREGEATSLELSLASNDTI